MDRLKSKKPLNNYVREWNGFDLREITDMELISLAVRDGAQASVGKTFKKYYGAKLPMPGTYEITKTGMVLWMSPDQYFLLQNGTDETADRAVNTKLGDDVYTVLQTDGWAHLCASGDRIYDIFERFIVLDIRGMKIGSITRTSAHHHSVIIIKISDSEYQLLTPRSSCQSFLSALEHVINNVV